jgi:hypothetical protein
VRQHVLSRPTDPLPRAGWLAILQDTGGRRAEASSYCVASRRSADGSDGLARWETVVIQDSRTRISGMVGRVLGLLSGLCRSG